MKTEPATTITEIYKTVQPDQPLEYGDERYVDLSEVRGEDDLSRPLVRRICAAPSGSYLRHLITGHRGDGKSTDQTSWWQQQGNWFSTGRLLLIVLTVILFGNSGCSPFKATAVPTVTNVLPTTVVNSPVPIYTPTQIFTDTPNPTNTPNPTDTPAPLGIGSTYTSPIDEMTMVFVPAGEFDMGSVISGYTEEDERPVHPVNLDAYWIDKTEVTTTKFAKFLNENNLGYFWDNVGKTYALIEKIDGEWQPKKGYEDHPMVYVSWYGAQAYCEWAEKRLPTEEEWEKAAGGGSSHFRWPWGNEWDCYKTNVMTACDDYDRTAPVGSFPDGASPYGALDMAGNVWEWVADWYDNKAYKYPGSPLHGFNRVLRGGSYLDDRSGARTTDRDCYQPERATGQMGFRCVLSATQP